ncbi:phosphotransferase [Nanoarchaeota archaeon]
MYDDQVNKIVKHFAQIKLGKPIYKFSTTKLGLGENNINYKLNLNNQKYVIRIGLRKEFESNMKKEFFSLKLLPKDMGSQPIYFDNSKKIVPKVYSILSFIEGKKVIRWQNKHLKLHAEKLAHLHKKKYPFHGNIYKKFKTNIDLHKRLQRDMKEFGTTLKNRNIQRILPKVEQYIKDNNHLFQKLKKFSLIHGDPCIDNILFTKDKIHYIDWEWTQFYDPAEDVSRFFFPDIACNPWYIKLSKEKINYFLKHYLKINPDKTLRQRVKVKNTFLKFTDYVYFKWKLDNWKTETSQLPKSHYQNIVKVMQNSLEKQFL